jgi:hypothetical protein
MTDKELFFLCLERYDNAQRVEFDELATRPRDVDLAFVKAMGEALEKGRTLSFYKGRGNQGLSFRVQAAQCAVEINKGGQVGVMCPKNRIVSLKEKYHNALAIMLDIDKNKISVKSVSAGLIITLKNNNGKISK